jgi:hypothetical protein
MTAWRSKLVFVLIVYFAGFATAIYTLAPAPQDKGRQNCQESFAFTALKSDEFAKSFNKGMHKCIDFSKECALRAAKRIKQELNEVKGQEDS